MQIKQASLPTDAPTLQVANDMLRVRLAEQEQIVAQERARADAAEQQCAAQRAQLDDAHTALTAAGVACEPHEPHEGCATQLGHRVRALTGHSDAREALAAYAHEAWSGWKEYEFSKGTLNADGTWTMPAWAVERWTRQMHTPYDALPEAEKDSDRAEADAMLAIVRAALEGAAG